MFITSFLFDTKKLKIYKLGCPRRWCQASVKIETYTLMKAWGKDVAKNSEIT
jgi:hypothetical protein